MFLSGIQIRIRLDSRLKHAGMTDFDLAICLTQQAAGNEPSAIQMIQHLPNVRNSSADEKSKRLRAGESAPLWFVVGRR
jgi:hypothetical protein